MAKVFIRMDPTEFNGTSVDASYRKDAADAMFQATKKALRQKCNVDVDSSPPPKSGLSLRGAIESVSVTPVSGQAKVKIKLNMQLALWPAPSTKAKDGEDMFGLITGSATVVDGASARQVRDSVLFAVTTASQDVVRNRIDAGILAWQAKTNAKLDKCEPPVKP
jgi:hypothetical protein